MKKYSVGLKVKATHDIKLHDCIIPKETIGHISRISPRLKNSIFFESGLANDGICLKFPKITAFFGLKSEIEIL